MEEFAKTVPSTRYNVMVENINDRRKIIKTTASIIIKTLSFISVSY